MQAVTNITHTHTHTRSLAPHSPRLLRELLLSESDGMVDRMLEVEPAGRQRSKTSSLEVGERESLDAAVAAAAAAALCRW